MKNGRPPFARLKLNAALESRRRLPREVVLTVRPKSGFLAKRITIRSQHQMIDRLAETDRNRVAQIEQFMAIFSPVSFQDYQAGIGK